MLKINATQKKKGKIWIASYVVFAANGQQKTPSSRSRLKWLGKTDYNLLFVDYCLCCFISRMLTDNPIKSIEPGAFRIGGPRLEM